MDLQALQSAGLYDPAGPGAAERRDLLAFLVAEGCSVQEMQVAHQAGRLFALAGDRQIRPVVGLLTLREAAARLEVDPVVLRRAWRTFGLRDEGLDVALCTSDDVLALRTYLDIRASLGEETALGLARVTGSAIARITEAESAALRTALEGVIDVGVTGSELVTAQAFATVARLVPRVGHLLDTFHRQHLEATRAHFEHVTWDPLDRNSFQIGVGFADLSGFTRLSQQLPLADLSRVLSVFEETASDTVQARGGRVVKFLGDAVMWVATEPGELAGIAADLVTHPRAALAGIEVRAGVAFGPVLAQDGDYFGSPVNLASRLVAVAEPGQVLGDHGLADLLDGDWLAVPGSPQVLRGFDDAVTPYALTRSG